jgi:Acetyltransferase (GNAT) family
MESKQSREHVFHELEKSDYIIQPDQDVVIDIFRPEDAKGFARCYYAIYRDSFPMGYVYDPDAIIAVNGTDDHFTVVARTELGDVVGLAGMFRGGQAKGVYEVGQLMVLKAFRNRQIGEKISDYIFNTLAPKIGVTTLFAEALCNHTISQKIVAKNNTHPCGLEVEIMPAEAFVAEGGVSRRVSLLMMFRMMQDLPHTVYVPEALHDFFKKRYELLGVSRKIECSVDAPTSKTELTSAIIAGAGITKIMVTRIGSDLSKQITQIIDTSEDNAIVHVQLNLTDHSVDWGYRKLAKLGFFFGGLLPLWFGTDGMFLQRLTLKPDFTSIQLFSEDAESIGDIIQKDVSQNRIFA